MELNKQFTTMSATLLSVKPPILVARQPKPDNRQKSRSILGWKSVSPQAILGCMVLTPIYDSMFQLHLPIVEKLLRPVVVYLVLVLLLRIFGKRELAQLNPFDLVVLLSLSNTVQNAIIGDDNSVTGGLIGAFSLLAINWFVARVLFRSPKLTRTLEGRSTVLVRDGQLDKRAMEKESLTREELLDVIHRQGFEEFHQIHKCELEPSGTFYIESINPSSDDKRHTELLARLDALSREIATLRAQPASG